MSRRVHELPSEALPSAVARSKPTETAVDVLHSGRRGVHEVGVAVPDVADVAVE